MFEKKIPGFSSPDLNKLQAVIIDGRTTIFINKDADPLKAKKLYEERRNIINIKLKS
jgi:hypothetical protein